MDSVWLGSTVDTILWWATGLIIVSAGIWLVLSIFDYFRRRGLNLTEAETVSQDNVKPGFLKVDEEKRKAALEGGSSFDAMVAARDAPETPIVKACGWARAITIGLAALSLITGIIGALLRVRLYENVAKDYGSLDSAKQMIDTYPVGFAIALLVIVVAIAGFIKTARSETT